MTYDEFYNEITTLLASDVGFYTTPSKATMPAFWERPPQVPANWKATGLEVIFQKTLRIEKDQPVTGGAVGSVYTRGWWVVQLVQWDVTASTEQARDKIRFHSLFSVVRCDDTPATDLTYEQTVVRVFNPDLQARI